MLNKKLGWILLLVAATAYGQSYPNRAVRVVVPAATGGPDIVARVVAAQLQAQLGQPFVVENRPGANGIVGADIVAKSAPDGYTLMVYSSGFVINPFVHKKLPYDTEKDFTPVTNLVSNGGLFLAVHPSVRAQNLQELRGIDLGHWPASDVRKYVGLEPVAKLLDRSAFYFFATSARTTSG